MKPKYVLPIILLTGLTLAGCHHTTQDHPKINHGETESSRQNSNRPEAAQATVKPYHVPKSEAKQSNYKKSGLLRLPGQFSYDQVGTKLTLQQSKKAAYQTSKDGITYRIQQIKQFKNQANTEQSKSMAQQAFNIAAMPNPYKTLQLKVTISNRTSKLVKLNGVSGFIYNGTRKISPSSGISDPTAGQSLSAGQTKTSSIMILVGPAKTTLDSFSVQFSGTYNASGKQLTRQPSPISVKL